MIPTKTTNQKTFDCIAYKRGVQREIQERVKDMAPRERIAYYERAAEEGSLGEWWKRIKRRQTDHEANR